jgi:type I restriction enzyme S subunit
VSERISGWAIAKISDITEYLSRGKQPKYAIHSSLPVINQRAIRWFGIQNEHLKYVDSAQFDQWEPERFIRPGDILWNSTGTGTLGRACLVAQRDLDPPKVVDSHVTIVRPYQAAVDPRFLFSWIQSSEVQENIASLATGATNQIELSRAAIASMRIPIAPLNEQKRIADKLDALLSRVNACRNRLDRVSLILDRFRQSVLLVAMSGELTEDWRNNRDAEFNWQNITLQSVATVGTGSTPSRSNPSYFANRGTPWIKSAATGQPFVYDADEFVTEAAISAHRLTKYPVGTLLVAMYGEGKTRGQVSELLIEATINQACAAIIVDESLAARTYVKLALQANYLQMRELAEGASQPNLNLSKIQNFAFPLPSLDEQSEIVRRVEALSTYVDRLKAYQQNALMQVEQLTPALLSQAFRGELVLQDSNDEPASVLLERIRTERAAQSIRPKKVSIDRKPTMSKLTKKSVKEAIDQLPVEKFSFNELREKISGKHDDLRDFLFELLDETEPSVIQVFDEDMKAMRFIGRQK